MSSAEITNEGHIQTANYLLNLLDRQIEKIRSFDVDGAYKLGEEASELSGSISGSGILDQPQHSQLKNQIEGKYRQLRLIIGTQRGQVSEKLSQIRNAKVAFNGYKKAGSY